MKNEEVIRQLREYMRLNDLKKYQLANAIGTTEANIWRWLTGKHKVSKLWIEAMKTKGILKER